MLKGIHLTLMVGPAVPRAASYEVMEALTSVEVRTETKKASTFQLQFQVGKRSKLDEIFMLAGLSPIPIMRVIVAVTVNGQPSVLIDGVMTNHQYAPGMSGLSTLTLTGEDLTRVMDFQDLSGIPFPAMPAFARVALLLAKYSPLGVIPKVVPNAGFVSTPVEHIPVQQGTDLQYICMLAKRTGYEFYHEPLGTPGRSVAYWGPTIKFGQAQPALTMNMDAHNNVESLNFSYDPHKRTLPIAMIQEKNSKIPIPIPVGDISPLNPPLGRVIPPPTRFEIYRRGSAKMSFAEAIEGALAVASRSSDLVSATGSLDVLRYGRVLQTRKLVGVRGAGTAFDGTYYVEKVTHKIKRGEYKQDFELSRNALVSLRNRIPA